MPRLADVAMWLADGETVTFRPTGNSMSPYIHSGDWVTVKPAFDCDPGDIVLVRVRGRFVLHFCKARDPRRGYLIANARGRINGWTKNIYGVMVR